MVKQIMVLPLTLMALNFSFQNCAMASEAGSTPMLNSSEVFSATTPSLATIKENSVFDSSVVKGRRVREHRGSIPAEMYKIPTFNPDEFKIPPFKPTSKNSPEAKNKKPDLSLKLSDSAFDEDVPSVEIRPSKIASVPEMDKLLPETNQAGQMIKSRSNVFQENKMDEGRVSESKISEDRMGSNHQFDPDPGSTLRFNANAFLEIYLRRIVTKSLMKGDVKDDLSRLADKLDSVISKAQNNSLFLLKCFSSKKAQRFQENVQMLRNLITSSYSCCCLFTQSVPVAMHNAEVLANLDRSAHQALKNFDKLTGEIQKRMKMRNQRVTNTINTIIASFVEKAGKLKGTVVRLQKVCDPKIDRITLIESIMDSISEDMEDQDLSVEL